MHPPVGGNVLDIASPLAKCLISTLGADTVGVRLTVVGTPESPRKIAATDSVSSDIGEGSNET